MRSDILSHRFIWAYTLGALSLLLAACVLLWFFFSLSLAIGVFVLGLLALLVRHLIKLEALVNWATQPLGTPTPRAFGTWDHVFAALARHSRIAYDQRERLSQSLARFREASQAMPDGVIYLTRQNVIEWINRAAEHHFGLDGKRDQGQPITRLVRQPDFIEYIEAEDHAEPRILRPLRADGMTLSLQVVPFGEDLRMLISRDISQLEKLENMRRDFVANVSHELRTPLTVVNGFMEMLHDGFEDIPADEARRYLALAQSQSTRMQQIIEDLLALSALETSATIPVEERVDVQGLLRMVAQEMKLLSGGRHEIVVEEGEPAVLLGSQKEIHSVLANLASNAVRYTQEGGRICIGWYAQHDGGELAVRDNGPGIAAHHLPRLTERFYRVDRGRSRETGGTGLGLAIVKHVLSRHQATLEIESEPGHGSRFAARFPARRIADPEAGAGSQSSASSSGSRE